MVVNTRIQRVAQAVREGRVSIRLVLVLGASLMAFLYIMGQAWVMWGYDVYTRQDKVAGVMLIVTMSAAIAIIYSVVRMCTRKNDR